MFSLSRVLLGVAIATALVPVAALGLRSPRSIRDLARATVIAGLTLGIGTIVTSRFFALGLFALVHLAYLVVVVSIPVMLGTWFALSLIRRARSRLLDTGAVLGILLASAGGYATHIEPNLLRTDTVRLTADVATPVRIGVIADLQTPGVGDHEWRAINEMIASEPDIVVMPGDLFQGPPATIAAHLDEFVVLLQWLDENVPTIVIVSGDTDQPSVVEAIARSTGAVFLDNGIRELTVAGTPVRVAGVAVRDSPERTSTLDALVQPFDGFTLLVAHRPDVVYELDPIADVDLVASGHTHGGQVAIPWYGPPVTASSVPRSVAKGGLGTVAGFSLYISTGVGLERGAAPQLRFGVRPSIGLVVVD